MKTFPIALQLYSVRDECSANFPDALRKVKQMGYDGVEFAGLYDHSPVELKSLCHEIGLVPLSAHIPFDDMMKNPEQVLKAYAEIGCRYVVIPYLTEEYRPGMEKFADIIEGAKKLGGIANTMGMKLLYHNHDFEFTKIDGSYALDIVYSRVPSNILQTELDTCWIKVGGEEPADYIRKYAGRSPLVHLKDYAGQKSEHMYALIGIDDTDQKAQSAGKFEFRPVGSGVLDFSSILKAAEEAGSDWIVVEQDMPSMGKSPMECAKLSIDYLHSLYQA